MQTAVGRVPCRPQDASLPCNAALTAPSSQQKVVPGPPSPRKCLAPGAPGSLPQRWRPWETPEGFPTGRCPPPAPEVSSVTPALPGTPLSLYALQSPLSSQETHLCIPWSVNNIKPQTGKAPWKPARLDCPLCWTQDSSPTRKALESKILCLALCLPVGHGTTEKHRGTSVPPQPRRDWPSWAEA